MEPGVGLLADPRDSPSPTPDQVLRPQGLLGYSVEDHQHLLAVHLDAKDWFLSNLAETANKEYNMRYPKTIEKQKQVNYKAELIGLLGLRAWATKEDIINELSELL